MKNKFSNRIYNDLTEKKHTSLKILLEKDDDMFDMPDDDTDSDSDNAEGGTENTDTDSSGSSTSSGSGGNTPSSDSGEASTKNTDSENTDDDDKDKKDQKVDGVTKGQFDEMIRNIELIQRTIDKATKKDGSQNVEGYMQSFVVPKAESDEIESDKETKSESYERTIQKKISEIADNIRKNSIKSFLLEADSDIEEVEANLDDLDRVLSKGSAIVDKFKKGNEIDIESYVEAAINAYKNFDNLFAKELIVKQASINVLILNSGARAEENVREFEEQFHEELYSNFGIEYEDQMVKSVGYESAAGAKSST